MVCLSGGADTIKNPAVYAGSIVGVFAGETLVRTQPPAASFMLLAC